MLYNRIYRQISSERIFAASTNVIWKLLTRLRGKTPPRQCLLAPVSEGTGGHTLLFYKGHGLPIIKWSSCGLGGRSWTLLDATQRYSMLPDNGPCHLHFWTFEQTKFDFCGRKIVRWGQIFVFKESSQLSVQRTFFGGSKHVMLSFEAKSAHALKRTLSHWAALGTKVGAQSKSFLRLSFVLTTAHSLAVERPAFDRPFKS
jgi:hypothetical protein